MRIDEVNRGISKHRRKRRIGRGPGSGWGKTAARGHKGQLSRSGAKRRRGFEGGQMPLHRRLPKFGFTNIFRTEYQIVNVSDLTRCEPGEITGDTLVKAGLIKHTRQPIKILGNGNVEKVYVVKAAAFSKAAVVKLEAAGGKAEVVK